MKLIFLDIDGVINTPDTMHARHILASRKMKKFDLKYDDPGISELIRDDFGHLFEDTAVMYLDALVTEFNAHIVISSTWRYSGLSEMKQMWAKRKLPGKVIGITPSMGYPIEDETYGEEYRTTARGFEIKQFLCDIQKGTTPITHCDIRTPQVIESYVIFDDDRDMLKEQWDNFVQCDVQHGLSYEQYEKARAILSNNTSKT